MVRPIMTPRAILNSVITDVARQCRVDPEQLRGKLRTRELVDARRLVAARLSARGMSEQRVADMMRVSLSTARDYLKQEECHGQKNGTKGSGAASAARSEGGGEQAADGQVQGEGRWQGYQRQGR